MITVRQQGRYDQEIGDCNEFVEYFTSFVPTLSVSLQCLTFLSISLVARLVQGGGQAILRDPQRQRARLQHGRAFSALCNAAKARSQRDGDDRQRDQHLDQRETRGSQC